MRSRRDANLSLLGALFNLTAGKGTGVTSLHLPFIADFNAPADYLMRSKLEETGNKSEGGINYWRNLHLEPFFYTHLWSGFGAEISREIQGNETLKWNLPSGTAYRKVSLTQYRTKKIVCRVPYLSLSLLKCCISSFKITKDE
jgi:hypothetical protein